MQPNLRKIPDNRGMNKSILTVAALALTTAVFAMTAPAVNASAPTAAAPTTNATGGHTTLPDALLVRALGSTTLYPAPDGYRDSLKVIVAASTEQAAPLNYDGALNGKVTLHPASGQDLVVPFKMTDRSVVYNEDADAYYDGANTVQVSVKPGCLRGKATLSATLTLPDGTVLKSSGVGVNLAATAVKHISTTRNHTTIYPVKDGYRDSASVKVKTATTTGTTIKVAGAAVLKKGDKIVKTWHWTTSKDHTLTWNGRVAGKVKAGTYTLSIREKGAEGPTVSTKTSINVVAR
jgi:hypothetical protein